MVSPTSQVCRGQRTKLVDTLKAAVAALTSSRAVTVGSQSHFCCNYYERLL